MASRVDALQERLQTMLDIEFQMHNFSPTRTSGKSGGYSAATPSNSSRGRKVEKSPLTLPIGVGKRLDDMLMKGDLSIDEYVLKMSKLADDATESMEAGK